MAGSDGAHSYTHAGVSFHPAKRWHVRTGQALCAMMWFWVLYRAKEDGPVLLGWRHPWDHHHGHGHGSDSHSKAQH